MKRNDTTPFLQTLEPCVCVCDTHEKVRICADKLGNRKMCVQQVSVCTSPVVHTVVATTCVRNTINSIEKSLSKKNNIHHSTTILTKILQFVVLVRNPKKFSDFIIPCPSWSFLLVLVPPVGFSEYCEWRLLGFPEACVSERPTFLISWFWMMPLYGSFPIV